MSTKSWKPISVALYARVSTVGHGQDPEVQLQPLRRVAADRGWVITGEFVDIGVSGSKESRPELDGMMTLVRTGKVNVVAVARFDRLARSVQHLLTFLDVAAHDKPPDPGHPDRRNLDRVILAATSA